MSLGESKGEDIVTRCGCGVAPGTVLQVSRVRCWPWGKKSMGCSLYLFSFFAAL